MILLRIFSLLFFLLLAAGLMAWEIWAMIELAGPLELGSSAGGWWLYGIALLLGVGQSFAFSKWDLSRPMRWVSGFAVYGGLALALFFEFQERFLNSAGWGFLFPLDLVLMILIVAAAMPLILGRGEDLRAMAEKSGMAIVLMIFNLALPMNLARVFFGPEVANGAGVSTIVLLFFLFVDYYLIRSLIHYFSSGATTFISMRYLRKRPVSLASIMGVACGVTVLIVVNSIMNGFTSEYRSQVRGTMSDVLAQIEPDLYFPSEYEVSKELWSYCYAQVNADQALRAQWDDALRRAQMNLDDNEEGRVDYTPDEHANKAFPSTHTPDPDQITPELQRLDSAEGYVHTAALPVHQNLGRATPDAIYFAARYPNKRDRPEAIERMRSKLASKLFIPKMRAGIDVLRSVAEANPRTEAHAPRLEHFTVVRSDRSDEALQKAQVVAVDPIDETKVTNLGAYVRDAFYDTTRQEKVLMPLMRVLNGIILFEEATPELAERKLAAIQRDEEGNLVSHHGAWVDYVAERNLMSPNGAIRWQQIDAIDFRKGTIGAEAFAIWRAAVKRVSATSDPEALKEIVVGLEDELLTLIDLKLGKADSPELFDSAPSTWVDSKELFGTMKRYQSAKPVPSERAVLAYFRYWYVYGIWRRHAKMMARLNRLAREVFAVLSDPESEKIEPELQELWDGIDGRIARFAGSVLPGLLNPEAFEKASAAFYKELEAFRDEWYATGENEDILADYNPDAFSVLDSLSPSLYRVDRFLGDAPLSEVIRTWDKRWSESLRRAEAYQEVLPLRAHLLPYESVEEYTIRARGRLPYRADGEHWLDAKADFEKAKATALSMIREGFVAHRITRSADKARPLDVEIAKRESAFFDQILALTEASSDEISAIEYSNRAEADGVAQISNALESLRTKIADALSARRMAISEAGSTMEPQLRELFRVVDGDREYWRLRPLVPGVILGATLAEGINARIGATVQAPVFQVAKRDGLQDGPSHSFRAGEESFRVNARFKSGLYAANVERFFGDFETWMALFGASEADYVLSIKLAGYDASMNVGEEIVKSYRDELKARRDAIALPGFMANFWASGLSDEEAATLAGWCANPRDHFSRRRDRTRFTTWERENAALLSAVEREKKMLTILLGLIVVLAGVVILIVVYLTVVEKVKDIGILKAMGASPWGVRSIFMFNALYIGVFGTLIGAGLAIIISENLNQIEDWIEANFGVRLFPPDIYYLTYIPSIKGAALIELAVKMSVPTILWAFFCGIGPAMVASRKNTVEALQYE